MADYSQRVSDSFNERVRLIRLRRKKEDLHFWSEFKLIPRGVTVVVILLFLAAQVILFLANMYAIRQGGQTFPPDLQNDPLLAYFAGAGFVTLMTLFMASLIFMIAYVNRDARRRGMNAAVWTILVIICLPSWGLIGFIIYLLMREPLPYPCPQCGNSVGARFNFCPNCKCNLHPSCAQCKREVVETDKFCPYCGNDLKTPSSAVEVSAQNSV